MYQFFAAYILVTSLLASRSEAVTDTGVGYLHKLSVTQDVFLESSGNYNSYQFVIVGQHRSYPMKRSLLQFENLPSSCGHIKWAKMYLYYLYAHKPSWMSAQKAPYISRPLQVHQVKKQWSESQATKTHRLNGVKWSEPWLALDGSDADPNGLLCEPVTIYTNRPPGFVEFDITVAMRNWQSGDSNYGVLLMATNEEALGRDIRFTSKTSPNSNQHAYVNVLCDY